MCAWLVKMVMKLMLNGRSVPARTAAMVFDNASAGISPTPIEPSAPALLTATARLGAMPTNAMPAWAIGVVSPYASVNRVCRVMGPTMPDPHRNRVALSAPPGLQFVQRQFRATAVGRTPGGSHGGDGAAALVHAVRGAGPAVHVLAGADLRGVPRPHAGVRAAG